MSDLNRREEFRVEQIKEMTRVSGDLFGAIEEALTAGLEGKDFADYIADPLYASFVAQYGAEQLSPFALYDTPRQAWDWFYGRVRAGLEAVGAESKAQTIADWLGTAVVNGAKVSGTEATEGKMWLSRRDAKVRPFHVDADGQTVGWDEPFVVCGETEMLFPGEPVGDPECWLNCRCVASPAIIPTVQSSGKVAYPFEEDAMTATIEEDIAVEDDMPVEDEEVVYQPVPWHGVLAPEGVYTGDGRKFMPDSLTWRDLPLPLLWQEKSGMGHEGSVIVGQIANIFRENGLLIGEGTFSDTEEADKVVGLVANGDLRGVSVDVDQAEMSVEDDEKESMLFHKGRISAATMCAIPAFSEAYIAIGYRPVPEVADEEMPLVASPTGPVTGGEDVPLPFVSTGEHVLLLPTSLLAGRYSATDVLAVGDGLKMARADAGQHSTEMVEVRGTLRSHALLLGQFADPSLPRETMRQMAASGVVDSPVAGRVNEASPDEARAEMGRVLGNVSIDGVPLKHLLAAASGTGVVTDHRGVTVPSPALPVHVAPASGSGFTFASINAALGLHVESFKRGPGWLTDPVATKRIHDYWVVPGNEGYAKIGWGTPGDFRRLRAHLAKYISPVYLNRTTAQWHHDALGYWPGECGRPGNPPCGAKRGGLSSDDVLAAAASLYSVDWCAVCGVAWGSDTIGYASETGTHRGAVLVQGAESGAEGLLDVDGRSNGSSHRPDGRRPVRADVGRDWAASASSAPSGVGSAGRAHPAGYDGGPSLSAAIVHELSALGTRHTTEEHREAVGRARTRAGVPEGARQDREEEAATRGWLAASGVGLSGVQEGVRAVPSADWFSDPELSGPTPIAVTDDGRIFGHLAAFGVCHIGIPGTCVEAPSSPTDYAYYRTGVVMTDKGAIPVGQITMGTGHADMGANAKVAAAHYDNTGSVVADVAAGDDDYGIWVSGLIRPGTTPEQVAAIRAGALSGDWRSIGGHLELVAALVVNVPGFPIPHTGLAASGGVQSALVAAGLVEQSGTVADVDGAVAELVTAVADEVEARTRRRARAAALLEDTKALRVASLLNDMEV